MGLLYALLLGVIDEAPVHCLRCLVKSSFGIDLLWIKDLQFTSEGCRLEREGFEFNLLVLAFCSSVVFSF